MVLIVIILSVGKPSGIQGENGPIATTLFENDSPWDHITEKNRLTTSNFEGPMQGKTITD